MAKTLLDAVNEISKKVGVIAGDAAEFASLTDSARQRAINVSVQVINEGIDELYAQTNQSMPKQQAESTITLVAGQRAYALASDLVILLWPLIDRTNSQRIIEFPGGYNRIIDTDLEQDDTGLPYGAAIRPTDGYLYLDMEPTAAEAGRVYTYQYQRDTVLTAAADTMPFTDAVFRAMVPAWSQLWRREMRNQFEDTKFKESLARASRLLPKTPSKSHYCPR